jgi:hypothetical protein
MLKANTKHGHMRWVTLWVIGILTAAGLVPVVWAQNAGAGDSAKLAAEEKEACSKNLRIIYDAIQVFQEERRDLPNWLSDLVPQYLADANVLICPVCRRTGRTEAAPLADPKLPSSYLFEFCPVPLGTLATNAPNRTRREWKRRQMGLVGSQVPLVRCRHHKPVLNLAFDGRIYESPPSWEMLFTNRVSLADLSAARLFAGERPPAVKGRKKSVTAPAGAIPEAKAKE